MVCLKLHGSSYNIIEDVPTRSSRQLWLSIIQSYQTSRFLAIIQKIFQRYTLCRGYIKYTVYSFLVSCLELVSFFHLIFQSGKANLEDISYHYITAEQFYPDCLLDFLDLSTEHHNLDIVNHIEARMYEWKQILHSKHKMERMTNLSPSLPWARQKTVGDIERR